ncbi:MAG: iron ABC transporter permease [Lachnospiraceae bacterium]|nr:iron ABC transporter permease [Lachnospiraceae bacterium]
MKYYTKMILLLFAALAALLLGIGIGSVYVSPADILAIISNYFFETPLPETLPVSYPAMVLNMRLPRVFLAFLTGAALAMGGTVTQSILQNPLASPFGLGISAGAGLGAAIVITFGLTAAGLGAFLLPGVSLSFALATVFLVVFISSRLDKGVSNVTIILVGTVFSLFCNAVMNLLATSAPAYTARIQLWLSGSFSMKEWNAVWILALASILGLVFFLFYSRELDVMTFGEESAQAMGVDLVKLKRILLAAIAVLTGAAVAFVGIIGFVDLIAPHIVRRWFGASHKKVLPASALFGGTFLVLCDLAARTLLPAREIPIGSITALLGAPFFLYIFFAGRKNQ